MCPENIFSKEIVEIVFEFSSLIFHLRRTYFFIFVMNLHYVIVFFAFVFISIASGNKYTKEANSPSLDDVEIKDEDNFRTQKLNFVWSKAVRQLEASNRKEMFSHLRKLDKQFLAAKYERDDGADNERTLEKEVEKTLENLLKKFGLSAIYKSLASGAGDKSIASSKDTRNEAFAEDASKFKDEKLRRLWLDAVAQGVFDNDELTQLSEEFQHHQRKLDEYGKMSVDLTKKLSAEGKENSVFVEDFDEHKTKTQKANSDLKQRFKDIQQNYDTLKVKVADKLQSKKDAVESITHPRVVPLLEKARSIYADDQDALSSVEEELRHFQARLRKLEYLETEASQGEIDTPPKQKKEKSGGIYDRELSDQLTDYSRKVEKYEKYLASKLEL